MSRGIVYCPRCQTRLTGADLDQGRAVRIDQAICCARCMVPSERSALAKARAASTTRRRVSASRRSRLVFAGGGAILLLALVLAALALSG